jgi:hypothetical protein
MIRSALLLLFACAQPSPKESERAASSFEQSSAVQRSDSVEARRFVQAFYDWYKPLYDSDRLDPISIVLSTRSHWLTPDFAAALRGDSTARADTIQFRMTLNFDPFLWSQDPCPRYEVSSIRPTKDSFKARVRPVCQPGSQAAKWQTNEPTVEVLRDGDQWRIKNVFYGPSDLISMLCGFAKDDSRPAKRPAGCPAP